MRLLRAVRPPAHRERTRDGRCDRLGPQEPREVAGADSAQRVARGRDERDARRVVELVDGVAIEIDDPVERQLAHPAEGSGARRRLFSRMEVYLETERLQLRRFTAGDVDLLVELDSDPAVMRFINGGRPTPREEIESDILPAWLAYYERYAGYGFWAAIEKATGAFVGWFHLRPGDDGVPGARARLPPARRAWGKGYATEGSRALVDHAFRELGAERVRPRRWPSTGAHGASWKRRACATCARSTRTGPMRSRATSTATSNTRLRGPSGLR